MDHFDARGTRPFVSGLLSAESETRATTRKPQHAAQVWRIVEAARRTHEPAHGANKVTRETTAPTSHESHRGLNTACPRSGTQAHYRSRQSLATVRRHQFQLELQNPPNYEALKGTPTSAFRTASHVGCAQ